MIRNILLRTFAHATEDISRVKSSLTLFLSEGCEIKTTMTKGHFGNPITVLEANLDPEYHQLFLAVLRNLPKAELLQLKDELKRHIDDDCNFYIRFDKQAAYRGDVKLAQTDDAVVAKMKIISYPARRENAIRFMEGLLDAQLL
ncbi:MAG: RNA-binding domain-containing protein [Methanocellales archaeon]|nr:RNA-binding domain-containing protein [Methanocellales archaeon]MDD3291608.1 RNA-binding domain-containing protein [Methanocellales archaeon]MDD5235177.1 RNA-binding domain-containing protein [Methanocellales archaeon]MDD5485391.1 RNA-binding domain-containing protein [Methanocellales archaeon]